MKKKVAISLLIVTIILICFLMRNSIVNCIVEYKIIDTRKLIYKPDKNFVDFSYNQLSDFEDYTIELIIKKTLIATSKKLNFTTSKADNNPNVLLKSSKAHCVGYAQFFALSCTILLKKSKLNHEWTAKPYVAQLYIFKKNIHNYFSSPFLKNHDIVVIENLKTKEKIAIDPTLYDYFLIDEVPLRK